jgi:transcriptional regulator with XRE-family HTH domain
MPTRTRIRTRKPVPGRPKGATTFDASAAAAFGAAVRDARARAELSQEELAHQCGLDRSYFSKLERGLSQPTLSAIFKIAKALGYSPGTLIGMAYRRMNAIEPA